MSTKICVQTEIREAAILKDTLEEMGISHIIENDVVRIQNLSYPVTINLQTGDLNYDSDQKSQVQDIVQQYAANWWKNECLKEGTETRQEVDAHGRIHIYGGC
ncbi:MAG: hypothetical protein IMZ64_14020 [Bacteroidetes bacterium]|nr:hypothetical protein [Bacteroidota bacterium]